MQKVKQALERLNAALDRLENIMPDASQTAELDALNEQAAHLRAEISTLKKANEQLHSQNRRAAAQVDKAMSQIDTVLEGQ